MQKKNPQIFLHSEHLRIKCYPCDDIALDRIENIMEKKGGNAGDQHFFSFQKPSSSGYDTHLIDW